VVLGDLDLDATESAVEKLGSREVAAAVRCDVTNAAELETLIAAAVDAFGGLDVMVNNACITRDAKAAAEEVAHLGVRINAIQPGLIRSAMTEAMPQRIWDAKLAEVPMARAGEPDEVANVALLLASDLSSYMTGTVLGVAGGRYI
jgi:3-oxoacyl-[acyl-carrier protein] reductase